MRQEIRDAVRLAFDAQCGYCGVSEIDVGARLTVDHFRPVAHGGTDDFDNLVYCCSMCNTFKSDYFDTDPDRALLHPKRDNVTIHYVESIAHVLVALTERGREHIAVLHLNRLELVSRRQRNHRERARDAVLRDLTERFGGLEAEIRRLQDRLNR